jgi:hypothetical protein
MTSAQCARLREADPRCDRAAADHGRSVCVELAEIGY